jgi:hypothetical protein
MVVHPLGAIEAQDSVVQWWKRCSSKIHGKEVWEIRAVGNTSCLGSTLDLVPGFSCFYKNCLKSSMACIRLAARTTTHWHNNINSRQLYTDSRKEFCHISIPALA